MMKYLQSAYSAAVKFIRTERFAIGSYLLLVSAVVISICSMSSFLYPFQLSVDANCFMTVGRAMADGKVLYRDIYEQKGILTYVIHMLASLVSSKSFIGMYFIEIACLTVTLCLGYKTMRLWLGKTVSLVAVTVFSALVFSSRANVLGDNVEELCYPMIMLAIYYFSRHAVENNWDFTDRELFWCGFSAGLVFWIKFNLLGLHFVWMAAIFFALIAQKKFARAFISCGVFLLGMLAVSAPILLYFAVNGALDDCWRSYFFNNVFLYTSIGTEEITAMTKLSRFVDITLYSCRLNMGFTLLLFIGGAWVLFTKKLFSGIGFRLAFAAMVCFQTIVVFGPGNMSSYYILALAMPAIIGIPALVQFFAETAKFIASHNGLTEKYEKIAAYRPTRKAGVAAAAAALVVCAAVCLLVSNNVRFMKYDKEDLMQYKFAEIINRQEDATLLNYGTLDQGLYTVAEIIPDCKYFCNLNLSYDVFPELMDTQNEFVSSRRPDFVLVSNLGTVDEIPEIVLENYQIAAQAYQPESSFLHVLLERIEDGE